MAGVREQSRSWPGGETGIPRVCSLKRITPLVGQSSNSPSTIAISAWFQGYTFHGTVPGYSTHGRQDAFLLCREPGLRLSPFLASHQHEQRWWMLPLQPLTFLWAEALGSFLDAFGVCAATNITVFIAEFAHFRFRLMML